MKKLVILSTAALAIVLLLGAPFVTGVLAESRLKYRLSAIEERPLLVTELTSYERGWFTSHVEMEIGLGPDAIARGGAAMADVLRTRVPIVVDIVHGPISFVDGFHIGLTRVVARPNPESSIAQFATDELGMPYLFEFRGHAELGNRFEFDADVPPVDYSGQTGDAAFSGLTVSGVQDHNTLEIEAASDKLSYQGIFATGAIESVAFRSQYEFRPDDWPLSAAELEIGHVVASSPLLGATPLLEASGLMLSAGIALDDAGADLELSSSYAADSIAWRRDIEVTDLALALALSDVDAAAAKEYYAASQEALETAGVDPATVPDRLAAAGERILAGGPRAALDPIAFSMPEGRFEGSIVIEIDPSGLPPGQPTDLRNIAVLLGVLNASADAAVDKPLAHRLAALWAEAQLSAAAIQRGETPGPGETETLAEAQADYTLTALVDEGILVDEGERYSASLRYEQGTATVNGAPMSGLF